MRENTYILLFTLLLVPLAGELRIHPFGDDFRIAFGSTAFFFMLLWIRKLPSLVTGGLVGMAVVLFRMINDVWADGGFIQAESFGQHFPAFFYYFTYGFLFDLLRINRKHDSPLLVGFLAVIIDIAANLMELAWRNSLFVTDGMVIFNISMVALIRSFFVLGFFNIIQLRQVKWMEEQQRQRNEQMFLLISDLYEETFQLKKNLQNAEDVTKECYDLYRMLMGNQEGVMQAVSEKALHIAGKVHDIKKDNQRIYAGLSRLISNEIPTHYMDIEELGRIIIRTNENYARMLSKDILFEVDIRVHHSLFPIYTTLSIVNNLVANAIESIKGKGTIGISIVQEGDWVKLRVRDDGPGIKVKDHSMLFQPGFTTKYDVSGNPSTGIGLSYVKEVIHHLNGTIAIETKEEAGSTVFCIAIPLPALLQVS
ncbi:ATP-binding protein [Ammoniphilus sp. 3BR4]|uniref:ATP-binding protein n=1 Tax=Ammoniphilus sp. 3BR4 TaxID=3158265 RepID=UPI003467B248